MNGENTTQFTVLHGDKEHDIRQFLRHHPGGIGTLLHYKGRDISSGMEKFNHSIGAYNLLNEFNLENTSKMKKLHNTSLDINNKERIEDELIGGKNYVPEGSEEMGSGKSCKIYEETMSDDKIKEKLQLNGKIITHEDFQSPEDVKFLTELEDRLDWTKPMYHQIHKLEHHYDLWVTSPVYRKLRVFNTDFMENFTNTPWYAVPLFWVPLMVCMLATQYEKHVINPGVGKEPLSHQGYLTSFALGFLTWTLVEYIMHRWVFHFNPGNSLFLKKIHFLIHGLHHKVPFDAHRQVFPPIPGIIVALLIFPLFYVAFSYPVISFVGKLTGYVAYDMTHYYMHQGSPVDGTYLYDLKRYHTNHHFLNHDKAFGVTSKLWDYVMLTHVNLKNLNFSLRW